jgi:hypothetical protein
LGPGLKAASQFGGTCTPKTPSGHPDRHGFRSLFTTSARHRGLLSLPLLLSLLLLLSLVHYLVHFAAAAEIIAEAYCRYQ